MAKKRKGDRCWLCGVIYPHVATETWQGESDSLKVPVGSVGFAVLDCKGSDRRELCEICYFKKDLEYKLCAEDLYHAHLEFGRHFAMRGDLQKAKAALTKCRTIRETADALAMLAYVEMALGRKVADELYRKALELDPEHFMARENLRNLLPTDDDGTAQTDKDGFVEQRLRSNRRRQ
jgi:tetratricopeptide (TPR) repeat protein